jgi:DNA-binding MarR family transcriptional regulator
MPRRGTAPETEIHELRRLLRRVVGGLWRRRRRPPELVALLDHGGPAIGPRHVALLVYVGTEGARTVGQLADELGLSLPAASTLARDLEQHGLVRRSEAAEDKRRTVVDLHSSTEPRVRGWLDQRDEPLRKTLAALTPDERAAFLRGLETLANELMTESRCGSVRPHHRPPHRRRPHRDRPV